MSDKYSIVAVGKEEFVLPYGASGLKFRIAERWDEATRYIDGQDFGSTLFVIDEDIVKDIKEIESREKEGANILLIKGWGKSDLAEEKIRAATIRAIGTEIEEEKSDD